MDEPCSALDPIAMSKIEELILQLRGEYTVLMVTHNMQQASRVSDYTAFMYLGVLVEYGPTARMFTNPHLKETEDYITGRFASPHYSTQIICLRTVLWRAVEKLAPRTPS